MKTLNSRFIAAGQINPEFVYINAWQYKALFTIVELWVVQAAFCVCSKYHYAGSVRGWLYFNFLSVCLSRI
jgi:hypothetical protein